MRGGVRFFDSGPRADVEQCEFQLFRWRCCARLLCFGAFPQRSVTRTHTPCSVGITYSRRCSLLRWSRRRPIPAALRALEAVNAMVRRVVERAFRAAERAPNCGDVLIAVSHRPLAIAHRTAPLQLHTIVVNGVLQLNGAGRTASLASLGNLECYGGVRRRHEPTSLSSGADETRWSRSSGCIAGPQGDLETRCRIDLYVHWHSSSDWGPDVFAAPERERPSNLYQNGAAEPSLSRTVGVSAQYACGICVVSGPDPDGHVRGACVVFENGFQARWRI